MKKHQIKDHPKSRRSIGRKTWNLLSKLPLPIRGRIIRGLFEIDQTAEADLVFKRAETADEIQQAFRVAYEGYHERGLVPDSQVQLRVTKYHALPTTAILIAKKKDEVIATVTVVVDSALGLPLEKLWNLDELRKSTTRIAEISTLAIKRGFRAKRGKLLLPLCKYMYEYSLKFLGVDTFVASYHPEVQDFYRCILMFDDIDGGSAKSYDFVAGAAAVAGYLRINDLRKYYIKAYGERPHKRNVLHYFTKTKAPNFSFPERPFFKASDVTFNPSQLEYFFKNQTGVLDSLTPKEKNVISNAYFHSEFSNVLTKTGTDDLAEMENIIRDRARFASFCSVQLRFQNDPNIYSGVALEVSGRGLRLQMRDQLPEGKEGDVTISIDISESQTIPLSGTIAWNKNEVSRIGIQLNKFVPQAWHQFIGHLEQELIEYAQGRSEKITDRKNA